MRLLLAVGIGGFLGSCLRFCLTKALSSCTLLPMGTLISNVAAGVFIGVIIGFERGNLALSPTLKLFLTTGLLGGLSTFSTFSLETVALLEGGHYLKAGANTLLNVGLSLLAVVIGIGVMRKV